MKKTIIATLSLFIAASALNAETPVRYGTGLPATGSDKPVHTIFTNPGEDCTTEMNISFATPVGTTAYVMLSDGVDSTLIESKGVICTSFDSINSKLGDNADVYERHVFDKHYVGLVNLKADTKYSYQVGTGPLDNIVYGDTHEFRTAGAESWKAAIISDFHHYSPLWHRLDSSMGMLDVLDKVSGGYDWVLSPGDQCAWGGSYNYWTELAEQPAYKKYMWGAVEGNHDHMTRDNDKSDIFFRDTHANPLNGYSGQEGVVYWFKYGDVLFLMLNNEAMRTADSLKPVFSWMREVVAKNPAKYIVAVEHYEWLIGTNGVNSQLDRFRDIFDELGVDLAISGNNHAYLRTPALRNRQAVAGGKGTFYVVCSSSDDSRGRELKPLEANDDVISMRWSEGAKTIGGMIMDVNPSRIVMTLYDRNGSICDTFTVPAVR
ncbi:MAG: metallophosphoesterase family protein [Muribaculaceae bacterium]|nr:metallophosphoesterase family protein [Muribaculaceae bacterium]